MSARRRFRHGPGGRDISSVQYQNANNSVRVSDEFMTAVEKNQEFGLRSRTDGEVVETVDARGLFEKMRKAAWSAPTLASSTTTRSTTGTPTPRPVGSRRRTPAGVHVAGQLSCNLASLNP